MSDEEAGLPPGWQVVEDPEGSDRVYYWNMLTDQTQYEKPEAPAEQFMEEAKGLLAQSPSRASVENFYSKSIKDLNAARAAAEGALAPAAAGAAPAPAGATAPNVCPNVATGMFVSATIRAARVDISDYVKTVAHKDDWHDAIL